MTEKKEEKIEKVKTEHKQLTPEEQAAVNLAGLEIIMHESDECGKAHKEHKPKS